MKASIWVRAASAHGRIRWSRNVNVDVRLTREGDVSLRVSRETNDEMYLSMSEREARHVAQALLRELEKKR